MSRVCHNIVLIHVLNCVCTNFVCTRGSWFSHLKTIYNLYVLFWISGIRKIPGGPQILGVRKIQQWGSIFLESIGLVA